MRSSKWSFESLEDRQLLSTTPQLLVDINTNTTTGSWPRQLTVIQDDLFFVAGTLEFGAEIWKLESGQNKPQLVTDLNPGPGSSVFPSPTLAKLGDRLIFGARADSRLPVTLWQLDPGQKPVEIRGSLSDGSTITLREPSHVSSLLGRLFFSALDNDDVRRLWVSDGTSEGTYALGVERELTLRSKLDPRRDFFRSIGDRILFIGEENNINSELWVSDGTSEGTFKVKELLAGAGGMSPSDPFVAVGDRAYFSFARDVWVSDGTAEGTSIVPRPETRTSAYSMIGYRDALHFIADREIFRLDPSTSEVVPLGINAIELYAVVNDRLLFTAINDGPRELWSTQGTLDSTFRLPTNMLAFQLPPGAMFENALYFASSGLTNEHGTELWATDGTPAGTRMVKDIQVGELSGIENTVNLDDNWLAATSAGVFFPAGDGTTGPELWRSDGSDAGTALVEQLNFRTDNTFLGIASHQDKLFVVANDGQSRSLWVSDGTAEGTYRHVELESPTSGAWGRVSLAESSANGDYYFANPDDGIWKTDGLTPQQVVTLDELDFANGCPQFCSFFITDQHIYLSNRVGSINEYWVTDAIGNSEQIAAESFEFLGGIGENTFYVTDKSKLWRRDESGSVLLKDWTGELIPNTGPDDLVRFERLFHKDDRIYFGRYKTSGGDLFASPNSREVWSTDGTIAGTRPEIGFPIWPRNPVWDGDRMFFFGPTDAGRVNNGLWVSDGTAAGTVLVRAFPRANEEFLPFSNPDVAPIPEPYELRNPAMLNGVLYFSAGDDGLGNELWRSDGTSEGTYLVRDLVIGKFSSDPANLVTIGDRIYFTASNGDGIRDDEIWMTDGTTSGTVRLFDFDLGAKGCRYVYNDCNRSRGKEIYAVNDRIVFRHTDGKHGRELFYIPTDVMPVSGDLDFDGVVTTADIDKLTRAIRTTEEYDSFFGFESYAFKDNSAAYDLNLDLVIDQADVDMLVEGILKTERGDTNLDGKVDFGDFLQLSTNYGSETAVWSEGDFDGDGKVSMNDFEILRAAFDDRSN